MGALHWLVLCYWSYWWRSLALRCRGAGEMWRRCGGDVAISGVEYKDNQTTLRQKVLR